MQQEETTFGRWLRQQRHTMDLTQAELATRIGYSVVTVRKLERDALRPSRQLAERLADLFGMAEGARGDLATLARTPFSPPPQRPDSPGHVLALSLLPAPLTPLTGRAAEVAEIARLLEASGCRLVTVAGPAGVGKTRLAVEVARTLAAQVPYPIRFVALADLHAAEAIVPALAEAVGCHFCDGILSPKQQLLDYLCRQEFLLVLDNVEHLLPEGAELIQELLQRCSDLRLLVTARERLQLSCESVYVLDGLTYPSDSPVRAAESYSAVKLFVETAQRVRRRFVLDAGSEQDVVEICRLVDGVPLAIVLAAAWVKILTPAQIAAELKQGPEFLEADLRDLPERQRSIKSVVAQSWHRLTAAERTVFMRLTVFCGGFTLPAAQRVAGASLPTIRVGHEVAGAPRT
ncbi:MAG: helix-turn-helix domain-containing protein [Caldilineaceae bacterium]